MECKRCQEWATRDESMRAAVLALNEQVRVLRAALEPFHVVITDWYGARGGGQSSLVIYRDEIEAVAVALAVKP